MPKKYFSGIDVVRFFAAVIVAIHHLGTAALLGQSNFPASIANPANVYGPAVPSGWAMWVGVEIFFVISGVVIAGSAFGRTAWSFARGRALRLYPAVWFCATVTFLILLGLNVHQSYMPVRWLGSMVISPIGPWIDPVFWTLGVELIFYLVVFVWLLRPWCEIEWLAAGLATWSSLFLVLKYNGLALHRLIERPLLLRHGVFFALGIFLWSWSAGRLRQSHAGFVALAAVGAIAEVHMKTVEGLADGLLAGLVQNRHLPVILFSTACLAIVASLKWASTRKPSPWLRRLGLATYPLYLLHTAVGGALMRVGMQHGLSAMNSLLCGILGAVVAALIVCEWIEPLIRRSLATQLEKPWIVRRTIAPPIPE